MAVAARAIYQMSFGAVDAFENRHPVSIRAAMYYGINGLAMVLRHGLAESFEICWGISAKNIGDGIHLEALHLAVDDLAGVLLALVGQMQIDHGCLQVGVTKIFLNDPQVHPGFKKMRGI